MGDLRQEPQRATAGISPGAAQQRTERRRLFEDSAKRQPGGFAKKDRITHRIPLESVSDIDDEVKHWLKVAYDRDE